MGLNNEFGLSVCIEEICKRMLCTTKVFGLCCEIQSTAENKESDVCDNVNGKKNSELISLVVVRERLFPSSFLISGSSCWFFFRRSTENIE